MIRMSRIFLFCSAFAVVLLSPVHAYERGDWLVRGQVAGTHADRGGDGLTTATLNDARFDYSEQWRLALQVDYMLLDGLSLGASAPLEAYRHHLFIDDGTASQRVMDVEALPLTISAAWYLPKWRSLRARLIGAWQYGYVSNDRFRSGSVPGINDASLENYSGPGIGLGIEWDRNSHWSWDFSVTQFALTQEMKIITAAGETSLDVDPQMLNWSLGLTRRF
jgi:outer membrane protein W